jgi:hypothetical protein
MQCQADWFNVYGSRALQHFGYITEPKVLTKDNAWSVRRDWTNDNHYVYNYLTQEQHSITEQQYNDETSITSDGRLNI